MYEESSGNEVCSVQKERKLLCRIVMESLECNTGRRFDMFLLTTRSSIAKLSIHIFRFLRLRIFTHLHLSLSFPKSYLHIYTTRSRRTSLTVGRIHTKSGIAALIHP